MMERQSLSREVLEKEILSFLDRTCGMVDPHPAPQGCGIVHRTSLVLATSYKDQPRATPLEFFHEGFTIYIFGEPGGKIANIKRNPKVAAAIYEQPLDHSKKQMSLQLWGKATLITVKNNEEMYWEKVNRWNIRGVAKKIMSPLIKGVTPQEQEKQLEKMIRALNLIRIEPSRMVLRTYNPDFSSQQYEWKKT